MTKKINKQELRAQVMALQIDGELKAQLLQAISEQKTFGLVWEEKEEEAQVVLRDHVPVFTEVKERAIISDDEDAPNHVLIEGDNLHALSALVYTHEGEFDAIYIDPPYNTGARDWRYNNDYVDSEDSYRHSKWISFMNHRLSIAKRLLNPENGIMVVAIDDYEVSHLSILLEELFAGYDICPVIVNHHPQGGSSDNISRTHEYALFVIPKGKKLLKGEKEEGVEEEWSLMRSGTDIRNLREGRPKSFYAIYVNKETYEVIGVGPELSRDDVYDSLKAPDGCFAIYPVSGGIERVWRYTRESMEEQIKLGVIKCTKNRSLKVIKKKDVKYKPVFSLWYGPRYNAGTNGTNLITSIFGENNFSYPKSIFTVFDTLKVCLHSSPYATILDFFAGSGTTLHATMQLNKEDGGHRQCILVTNNENNICEDVTYERNKRVIEGYTTPKGEAVEGLKGNSLRYFKTEFKSREKSHHSKRELVMALTDILRIKEDVYTEQEAFGSLSLKGKGQLMRYFAEGEKAMLIIYDTRVLPYVIKELKAMEQKVKVYIFCDGAYPYTEDFSEVADKVSLIPLPHAMSQALRNVLPEQADAALEMPELTDEEMAEMAADDDNETEA